MSTRGQTISDARVAPFSYITHATMRALHRYFELVEEAKLSTGIALYMGISYLLSTEERDGRHTTGIVKTREEIGDAGGLSANSVTRYSEHLVSAEVLELEKQLAGGANVYLWRLVEPPHQGGEAPQPHLHGGEAPHQGGDTPHQGGEAYIDRRKQLRKEETPCSPPEGDADIPQELFELWKSVTNRNGATKFDARRRRIIRTRLGEYPVEQLRRAIVGITCSDWHMKRGKHANRDGDRKDELSFILRDAENIERFAKLAGDLPVRRSLAPVVESERATAAWETAKARVLANSIPESTFNLWIAPLELAGERDGALVLIDSDERGGWTERRYSSLLREALAPYGYTSIEITTLTDLELQAA